MRKSKKRIIAIITCCIVLATFCVGVFADETDYDPYQDRIGMVLESRPFDLGDKIIDYSVSTALTFAPGYYIAKLELNDLDNNPYSAFCSYSFVFNGSNVDHYYLYKTEDERISIGYCFDEGTEYLFKRFFDSDGTYYIYVYFDTSLTIYRSQEVNDYVNLSFYYIGNNALDTVYSNSQDVNSSIVSVINEATNVITTNDVVMMFCILIPVISFGVGILIRLRKRA